MKSSATNKERNILISLIINGLAGASDACITNPLDIVKTRMQMQNELTKKGQKQYKSTISGIFQLIKEEGVFALAKGSQAACCHQFVVAGVRLSLYSKFKKYLNAYSDQPNFFFKNLAAGFFSACIGATLSTPFHKIRIRMQTQGTRFGLHSQTRKPIKNVFDGLKQLYQENGVIHGLFSNWQISALRMGISGSTQLAMYEGLRKYFNSNPLTKKLPNIIQMFAATSAASITQVYIRGPLDFIFSRLCSQKINPISKKGELYSGVFDLILKVWKTEGPIAFWKGTGASAFRTIPHSMLILTFWELYNNLAYKLGF